MSERTMWPIEHERNLSFTHFKVAISFLDFSSSSSLILATSFCRTLWISVWSCSLYLCSISLRMLFSRSLTLDSFTCCRCSNSSSMARSLSPGKNIHLGSGVQMNGVRERPKSAPCARVKRVKFF